MGQGGMAGRLGSPGSEGAPTLGRGIASGGRGGRTGRGGKDGRDGNEGNEGADMSGSGRVSTGSPPSPPGKAGRFGKLGSEPTPGRGNGSEISGNPGKLHLVIVVSPRLTTGLAAPVQSADRRARLVWCECGYSTKSTAVHLGPLSAGDSGQGCKIQLRR